MFNEFCKAQTTIIKAIKNDVKIKSIIISKVWVSTITWTWGMSLNCLNQLSIYRSNGKIIGNKRQDEKRFHWHSLCALKIQSQWNHPNPIACKIEFNGQWNYKT